MKPALDYHLADAHDIAVCSAALVECEICTGRVAVTSNALFGMNEIVSLGSLEDMINGVENRSHLILCNGESSGIDKGAACHSESQTW